MSEKSMNDSEIRGLSRRSFLKTAATAGVGAAAFAATGPAAAEAAAQAAPDVMTAELAAKKWAFEIAPDPIPESDIANTVTADIIVIGSGTSGLVCANAAVENGAKVVLISASAGNIARGGSNHAIKSKKLEALGIEPYDPGVFFKKELQSASFNVDESKWYKFANNSEEAMNWLIDKMEAAGYETVIEMGNTDVPEDGPMYMPPRSHSWITKDMTSAGAGQQFVVDTLAETAKAAGVQLFYKTVAKQLVREDNNTGRVTAVIAQGEDGKYTKYVGSKAIVMAMGDFSADKEMMAKYCPSALPLLSDAGDKGYDNGLKVGGLFKGDGQKMGLWIGAAWQKTFPNCPMVLVGAGGAGLPSPQPYGAHRGLLINQKGYRYANEDNNGSTSSISQMHQPGMKAYAIWDSNYAEASAPWYGFGFRYGDDPIPPADVVKGWKKSVRGGSLFSGDTIEEVIAKLGLPADTTKATIDRYNEQCKAGVDADFHKRKELLVPIETGPFYGGFYDIPTFLTVLGGLRTNNKMQVCDANDDPIPGLFNVGTMVGDYFANAYTFILQGQNLGSNCVTFGYVTGKAIATDQV